MKAIINILTLFVIRFVINYFITYQRIKVHCYKKRSDLKLLKNLFCWNFYLINVKNESVYINFTYFIFSF